MTKKKIAVLTSCWSVDYVLQAIDGMKKVCASHNMDLYVFSAYKFNEHNGEPNDTGFSIFNLMNPSEYEGIVIMPSLFNDENIATREYERLRASGAKVVSFDRDLEGFHFVNSLNHAEFREMVSHLCTKHGCKTLAYIGGPTGNPGADSNFNAFKEALEDNKISLNEDYLYLDGDWSYDFAYLQAKKLFEEHADALPDAVVCTNDLAAMAVINVAGQNNIKVPDQLKVTGFDDLKIATSVHPSITTINVNVEQKGEEAIKLLLGKSTKPKKVEVNSVLHYRQSCGCTNEMTCKQIQFSQDFPNLFDESLHFTSHLRRIEDVFLKSYNVELLQEKLAEFFVKRHFFEGDDFAILIKKDVFKNLHLEKSESAKSASYGKKMQVLVNLQDAKPVKCGSIETQNLFPDNMRSEEPSVYLFCPIFTHKFIQGYFVAKDDMRLLNNKYAYNWTRNIGISLEKFRQTSVYKNMSEKFEVMSTTDALSGMLNRAGLETKVQMLFDVRRAQKKSVTIIFVDINDMKKINDKHGHLHGDLAVKTVAESIRCALPEEFLIVRYGGDEFVCLGAPENCNLTPDVDFSEAIHDELSRKTKNMSLPYKLTVSIGQKAFASSQKITMQKAIDKADEIMYLHKTEYHKMNK